ncbi:MAG: DUF2335 domain-containing protein [Pseudomonadota bacterium]
MNHIGNVLKYAKNPKGHKNKMTRFLRNILDGVGSAMDISPVPRPIQKSIPASITHAEQHLEIHSAPRPHPSVLSEYNRIHPGFAARIMALIENMPVSPDNF